VAIARNSLLGELLRAMAEFVLASSADDQGIFASDLHTGSLVHTFEESAAHPHAFGTVGGSSGHIFSVQASKALFHVWTWGDRKSCYRASLPEKTTAMAFSSDGVLCFAGSASGSIYVWQLGTGSLLKCWPAHFREITQLTVSEDDSFLVSASADATVKVFNLADVFCEHNPRPFQTWSGHALAVSSIVCLPGGSGLQRTVASASLDRTVRLWDVGTGKPLATHTLPEPVHRLATGASGSELLCACGNGQLLSFSPHCGPGESGGLYVGHTGPVLSCDVSLDGSRAASCSEADRVRVWEPRTRQCLQQLHASRNVRIASVKIVQRSAYSPGLPPFQPFQRVLTSADDLPPVPILTSGRAAALQEAMEPFASSHDFIDRISWGQAAGLEALAQCQELETEVSAAKAGQQRWASAAAGLYELLADEGIGAKSLLPDKCVTNSRASVSLAVGAAAASVGSTSDALPSQGASSTPPPETAKQKKQIQGGQKKKKRRK